MKLREMDILMSHCNRYFGHDENEVRIFHNEGSEPHVDVLRYPPNKSLPYWKLVTMGASDYAMPGPKNAFGNRNEYVMLVSPKENLEDGKLAAWYLQKLYLLAAYPRNEKCYISYGHSVEWGEECGSDMVSVFLELPQVMENVGFLKCKLGFFKSTALLQAIPITRSETDRLLEIGPQEFSNWLYPEDGGEPHFLSERHRTENF